MDNLSQKKEGQIMVTPKDTVFEINTVRHNYCISGKDDNNAKKMRLSKKVRDIYGHKLYVMVKTSNPNLEAP